MSMKRTLQSARDERGVTVILVAILLVVLMGFAALAVDLGGVYSARRSDQTAADVAALAAAADLGDVPKMVEQAKARAHATLGEPISDEAWNSCPRPDPAGLASQAPGASCISYSSRQVRVRLPDRYYPATFGRVLGFEDYRHSAFAIAERSPAGIGGVLPWMTTSAGAEAGYQCIGADGPSECKNTTGKFGLLHFRYYTPVCAPGEHVQNIATGADHELSRFDHPPHGATPVLSSGGANNCPDLPNGTEPENGNEHAPLRHGLFYGLGNSNGLFRDGLPARLQRSVPEVTLPRATRYDRLVDDTPLWHFIPDEFPAGASVPASCHRDQFVNADGQPYANVNLNSHVPTIVRNHLKDRPLQDQMLGLLTRCFLHYMGKSYEGEPWGGLLEEPSDCPSSGCTDPVFTRRDQAEELGAWDIQFTPRFAYAPQALNVPSSGPIMFDRFRAIYIQRIIMGNDNNAKQVCRWDPGVPLEGGQCGPSLPSNPNTSILAFHFPDSMLPGGLGGPDAAFDPSLGRVSLVR